MDPEDRESIEDLLGGNPMFPEVASTSTNMEAWIRLMTAGVTAAVKEALAGSNPALDNQHHSRRLSVDGRTNNRVTYTPTQKEYKHKIERVREGNVQDLISLVESQQLIEEFAADQHLDTYHWSIVFGPSAKESITAFIYNNSHIREKLPAKVTSILLDNGPCIEILYMIPSEDLYNIVAYMLRPVTSTSCLQALKSVKINGSWQNTGMVVQLKARLQAFNEYLTLFERVYRIVALNRCKVGGKPLVEAANFHKISIMKRGAHVKAETVEAILRQAVVDHQLLSGNLFDYIVGPLRQDKLLSLMSMSCHRVHQLANSHNSTYQPKDHDIIDIMENPPEVTVLCSDQVVADQEGVKDLRKSLSYIIQYRIYMLKEYSTLTSELFATATQEQEKKKFSVNRNATPTNREVYLQLLDTMPAAMEDDIPDTGIDEMFSQLRNSEHVDQTSQQFNAMEKVLIPTGQGQFLKKHSGQQPRLQKKGCYLQADMGTCSRDKCRFDHSEEVLRETRKSQHFLEWQQRAGHKSRQLSHTTLLSVADYVARAELASQDAPPSPPATLEEDM